MAHHAAREQVDRVDDELKVQIGLRLLREQMEHAQKRTHVKGRPEPAHVPAITLEGHDERQEIQAQRQHPEKRHRRDVARELVRCRQKQNRPCCREAEPHESLEPVTLDPGGGARGPRRRGRICPRGPECADRSENRENHITDRPRAKLKRHRGPGLEQERIAPEPEERAEIREREEPIDARPIRLRYRPRDPALQKRVRRGQDDERQTQARSEKPQNHGGRIGGSRVDRLSRVDGQKEECRDEKDAMQERLPPSIEIAARKMCIDIAGKQHSLKKQ